jgi:hypothetical protein
VLLFPFSLTGMFGEHLCGVPLQEQSRESVELSLNRSQSNIYSVAAPVLLEHKIQCK